MSANVLVAGIGNVLLSDDGFGVEVARRLIDRRSELPDSVEVVDFGIRGMHLAYQLLDGYHTAVLVDTVQRGGAPGELYLLEHDLDQPDPGPGLLDSHGMDPVAVLATLRALAASAGVSRPVQRVFVVGCEPAVLEEGLGLSEPVAAAVDHAVRAVIDLVTEITPVTEPRTQGATRVPGHTR